MQPARARPRSDERPWSSPDARAPRRGEPRPARRAPCRPARSPPRARHSHSAAFRRANAASSSGRSASRLRTRAGFVAKRASAASSGRSSTAQRRAKRPSFAAATAIQPSSAERLVGDDARVGVAVARRLRAGHERVRRDVDEAGQGDVEQRHLEPVAPPGVAARGERREDARRGVSSPGEHVADGDTRPSSAPRPRSPVIAIRPLSACGDEVVARAVRTARGRIRSPLIEQ